MTIANVKKEANQSPIGSGKVFISSPSFRPVSIAVGAGGGMVVASLALAPNLQGLLGALLAIVTISIAFFDWRSFIIPNWLNAAGFLLGLVNVVSVAPGAVIWAVEMALIRALVAAAIFFGLRVLYAAVRGRQGLGLGDVKLAAVAAVWLDWTTLPLAIELAAATALCVYVLRQVLLGRHVSAQSMIPFGFFFAPAIWLCWFFQSTIYINILNG